MSDPTENTMSEEATSSEEKFHAGEQTAVEYEEWPDEIKEEFDENEYNGRVGTELLLENERVRVWEIRLEPGERLPVHRHVLDYFWVAVTPGHYLQRNEDGTTYEDPYDAGLTKFFTVDEGEYALHDLENVGDSEMVFTTVELKNSANDPLDL
jgi:quercetin dioxygenase-like cupin family protein